MQKYLARAAKMRLSIIVFLSIFQSTYTAEMKRALYTKDLYKYAIDGEMAKTMTPLGFTQKLHENNLIVEDAVKIQCQIQEEKAFEELYRVAGLTAYDQGLLQEILNLKHQCLEGHYNENNITFDGDFSPEITKLVKDTLQKADVPFKVRVYSINHKRKGVLAVTFAEISPSTDPALVHICPADAIVFNKKIDIKLYLNETLLSPTISSEKRKHTLTHEATHIINLHSIHHDLFNVYFSKIKNFDENIKKKCDKILNAIHEYQADVLQFTDSEQAKILLHVFSYNIEHDIEKPDIYISVENGCVLASRAIALHDQEKKIKMGFYDINSPNFLLDELRTKDEEIKAAEKR